MSRVIPPPRLGDALLAGLVGALMTVGLFVDPPARGRPGVAGLVVLGVVFVALAFRGRQPATVLAVTLAGAVVAAVAGDSAFVGASAAVLLATYTVAAKGGRAVAWGAGAATAAVLATAEVMWAPSTVPVVAGGGSGHRLPGFGFVLLVATATAIGDAVRSRRSVLAPVLRIGARSPGDRDPAGVPAGVLHRAPAPPAPAAAGPAVIPLSRNILHRLRTTRDD